MNDPAVKTSYWTRALCYLALVPLAGFLGNGFVVLACAIWLAAAIVRASARKFVYTAGPFMAVIGLSASLMGIVFSAGAWHERMVTTVILVSRFMVMIASGVLFSIVTKPAELPGALMAMKIPHRYGIALMLAMRLYPLTRQRLRAITDAQKARGAPYELSARAVVKLPSVVASVIVPLLKYVLDTSLNLVDTLKARGYSPHREITVPPQRFGLADLGLLTPSVALVVAAILLR